MKKLTTLSILLISLAFIVPVQVSAATNAGVKPGSFFYFFDTTFENVSLFFTFGPEKKAQKALEYADERLAEAEESANENNPKAVEKAMTGYKEEISLATEKSKGLKDEERAKELLNIVSENTAKHQEVLVSVLGKVPEEAKQAILNAIEVSKKGQEEAVKQITELKSEVEKLKKEVEELKAKNEAQTKATEEIKKQKSESVSVPAKSSALPEPQTPAKTIETQDTVPKISSDSLGSELLKFINTQLVEQIKSDLDYYQRTVSDLRDLINLQKDIAQKGEQNCLASYNSKVEYAKSDAERQKTAYYESRSGFATQPGIVQNIDAQLERDLQDIEMWKDECLAKYRVNTSLESRLSQVSSNLNSVRQRFNSSNNSVSSSEISSIRNEILSIASTLGSSLGVSGSVSLPSLRSQPSSVTCTNDISGFSCRDNFGSHVMRCSQSTPGFLNCSDSNYNSVSCQSGTISGSVRCSW